MLRCTRERMTDEIGAKPGKRVRWKLGAEAFEHLLAALHSDREIAGEKYESLRERLIDLFTWEKSAFPEDLADETLNRLARKISEGIVIEGFDRYAYGIARMILREAGREQQTRDTALRQMERQNREAATSGRALIEDCLAELPENSRDLIERYYAEDRAALAREYGLSLNALRNRALRIRDKLLECITRPRDIRRPGGQYE
jgi:DNA-directed RNA polymerase specialized sigma24 family protein